MGEIYVGTYMGCNIYRLTPPDVPEAVYHSPCVVGYYYKESAVRKRICQGRDGTWVDGECEFPPEPEPDEFIETYRGVDIYWQPAYNRYWAQVAIGSLAVEPTLPGIKILIDQILDVLEPPPEDEWTFLLEPIHDWFNNLMDKVVAIPAITLQSFWMEHIQPKLEWVRDQIDLTVNWVYDQLEPIMRGISVTLGYVWDGLATSINNMWTALATNITNIGSWIWNKVKPMLTAINTKIAETWETVSTTISTGLSGLLSAVSDSLTSFRTALTNAFNTGISWIGTNISEMASTLWTSISAGFNNVITQVATSAGAIWDSVLGLAGDLLEGMATKLGDALSGFWDWMLKRLGNTAEMIFGAVNFVIAKLRSGITTLLAGFLNILTDAMSPSSPPQEIMIASKVLMETTWKKQQEMIDEIYHSEPSGEDLSNTAWLIQASLMAAGTALIGTGVAADLAHPIKNAGFRATTRELVYWSGIPSVTAAIATVPVAIGVLIGLRYWFMKKYTPMIPPAVDIIRFSVREVYDPTRYDALIANYPGTEYQELMAKQGFKPKFAEHYWMSHWILPSVSQLNEMLYRGEIDADRWHDYVVWNDYIPEMVDKLKAIIYHPYTRVDIRRMWDMRIVSEKEVKENYLWLGYDEEHANKMTLWTKVYTAASDIRALYSRGHITGDQVQQSFIDLGVPAERAETFKNKLVTYVGPKRTETERDLTKADILRMLKNGIFTVNEATTFLMDIGYTEDEAAYLVELYQYQPLIEQKELSMANILKSYRYEIYSREETITALIEGGWSEAAAETLLQIEDIKLIDARTERARERDLTRTDIVKGMNFGIIDLETGYNYLSYLGYSDWEVGFIFALEGLT